MDVETFLRKQISEQLAKQGFEATEHVIEAAIGHYKRSSGSKNIFEECLKLAKSNSKRVKK